jgi:hypothetical protein
MMNVSCQELHEETVLVKNVVSRDVTPCGSRKNLRFAGKYRLHHQGEKNQRARNNVTGN